MTWRFDVNNWNSPTYGGAEVIFDWKQHLVTQAGWDVIASGGGTGSGLYSGVGDVIDTVAKMNVNLAWFVIRAPAAMSPRRQFLVQRGTANTAWRVAVSAEDGFTNPGGADEDTVFTATDQQFVIGTAAPAYGALFAAAGGFKHHIGADDASPFGWYFFCVPNGGGYATSYGIFDPLTNADSLDDDPAIYTWGLSGANLLKGSLNSGTGVCKGWYKKDLAGETFLSFHGSELLNSSGYFAGSLGTNPVDGKVNYMPIPYMRGGAEGNIGWKGWGTVLQWCTLQRSDMTTLSTGGTIDKVHAGNCVLPWPNVVPAV